MGHHDRRLAPRFPVAGRGVATSPRGAAHHCAVEDLSADGARLRGTPVAAPGSTVRLTLRVPGCAPVLVHGQITRAAGGEWAVRFRGLDAHAEEVIQSAWVAALERAHAGAVLVADLRSDERSALIQRLCSLSVHAVGAVTPLQAISALEHDPYRAVVAGLEVGWLSGLEFLRFVATDYPNVRRVLVTDPRFRRQVEAAVASGEVHAAVDPPPALHDFARALGL